jgi:hypothetical protein
MINRYGARAQKHWQTHRPTEYAEIPDPAEFFGRLGRRMSEEVNAISLSLAGDDPGDETFLRKVGRLRTARLQAEEQVMREYLLVPEPDES